MVSMPQKFEAKISTIEATCDLQSLTIVELISKLHVQEQRVLMRGDEANEVLFKQIIRERVLETCKERSSSRTTKGKLKDLREKKTFRLAIIAVEPTMLRKIVGTKVNLLLIVILQ